MTTQRYRNRTLLMQHSMSGDSKSGNTYLGKNNAQIQTGHCVEEHRNLVDKLFERLMHHAQAGWP
jgi:hypothetical protein